MRMQSKLYIGIALLFLVAVGIVLIFTTQNTTITTETIVIEDGQVVGFLDEDKLDFGEAEEHTSALRDKNAQPEKSETSTPPIQTTKEIFVTNGTRHSVPLSDIHGGGPRKDEIPSIDEPIFISIADASSFITDTEPGIAVSIDGINRFYPFQILVWHEIVNDTFNGKRVLVTYCPLCLSGIVFDPLVNGERVEFGTSGKLWNSNLVMYDRKTDSYWSQVLGEAIVGEMTGTQLEVLPSDMTRFGEWKKAHPKGQVLSRETGALRSYGYDPYGDYYTNNSKLYSPVDNTDDRLQSKDFVLGITINGESVAIYPKGIKNKGFVEQQFAGITLRAEYHAELNAVRLFEVKADGSKERLNPFPNFWFSWVAAHPDTEIIK